MSDVFISRSKSWLKTNTILKMMIIKHYPNEAEGMSCSVYGYGYFPRTLVGGGGGPGQWSVTRNHTDIH